MKPRIILLGNNTIAVKCLDFLLENKQNIVAGIPEPSDSGKDTWQKSFKKALIDNNIRILEPKKLDDPDFIEKIKRLKPKFIFSLQCRKIIKKNLINIPPGGIINLHFSYLPKNRGCYTIARALINNERITGVTLHYIDEGIDSGDIIAQKEIKIEAEDTGRSLFDKCTEMGFELFKENYHNIIEGKNSRIKQNDKEATYHGISSIDFKKNNITWDDDNTKVFNWIRAFIFPPFQYPYSSINGKKFFIKKVALGNELNKGNPGEIVSIEKNSIKVSTLNGNILIKEVGLENKDEKVQINEFINKFNIKIGNFLE